MQDTEVRRPRGWVLSLLFILMTAPLVAGIVLAGSLLAASLSERGVIDPTNDLIEGAFFVLQCVLAFGVLLTVFRVFSSRFGIRLADPAEKQTGFAPIGWAMVGAFLCFALLIAAKRLGIYSGGGMDFLLPVLAYCLVGHGPFRSLLASGDGSPGGPDGNSGQTDGASR